ncbi:MAG: hydroxymethylbilane synthase [Actinomycetota bacterium]|nr:hydroxymethylbilane synthase [Actinomycetota bacterium]
MRLGTRGSPLALAQAGLVADMLGEAQIVTVETSGDRGPSGDKARFVKELEEALLAGEVDLAVHSAKDVPAVLPEGLALVGVPDRADARDALCGAPALSELPVAATVGTASVRRRSQLLALRPDLEVSELRGNVDTRLRKLGGAELSAIVLACAGLARLGRSEGSPLAVADMTPAPGQGCLALEARSDDAVAAEAAASVTDPEALVCLTAERALVSALEATCDTPVGALAELEDQTLRLTAYAGLPDGSRWVRDRFEGPASEPAALGGSVAERMVAAGAGEILDEAEALAASHGAGQDGG